jgi:hypothetical protein
MWSLDAARPRDSLVLAVSINVADGWHIGNGRSAIPTEFADKVAPTEISLRLLSNDKAANKTASIAELATSSQASFPPEGSPGAEQGKLSGTTITYLPIAIPADTPPSTLDFEIRVRYQACDTKTCLAPTELKINTELKIVEANAMVGGCSAPELFERWSERRNQTPDSHAGNDLKSKQPPVGPAWVRDLKTAQQMGLMSGLPIFLYSTKTYCPHCVVVETEMLSNPKLKPWYDRAIFLYVYRDFDGGADDRAASRILDRYNLTSWPQLHLIDPRDLSMICEVDRTVESFEVSTRDRGFEPSSDPSSTQKLADLENKLEQFAASPSREQAIAMLQSDDVVEKITAVRFFVDQQESQLIAAHAKELLKKSNDVLSFLVLEAVGTAADGDDLENDYSELRELIGSLAVNPAPSRNPGLLRCFAIESLGYIGNASDIKTIAPFMLESTGDMVTVYSVAAIERICQRDTTAIPAAIEALQKSFPNPEVGSEEFVLKQATLVNETLQKLTKETLSIPSNWTVQSPTFMEQAWRKRLEAREK